MKPLILLCVLALAGCADPRPNVGGEMGGVAHTVQDPPASAFSDCKAAAAHYLGLVGQRLDEEPIPYKLYRIIPPNVAVTMDFNPERLNVYTDEHGVITDARCG